MNIDGLGEETVALLYDNGLVKDAADLYFLKKDQLLLLDRFAHKSAENAIRSIEKSKNVPFYRVVYAIGIRYVGEATARSLAQHFGSMEAIAKATYNELVEVEDIGDRIAQSIIEFFSNPANRQLVEKLKMAGLKLQVEQIENLQLSDALKGMSVVISGTFSKVSRDELKELIRQHGGKNVSSVSASTSLLIAGNNIGPSKLEKATKLGVKIVGEDEFFKLIGQE